MRFAAATLLVTHSLFAALASADEQAIRALVKNYLDAREKGDLAAVEALFTAEADQLVSTGEWRRGRSNLAAGAMASTRNNQAQRTIELQTIREIAPGVAIADGPYILTTPGQPQRQMWSTFVCRKQSGRWRIAAIRNMLPATP
jgi:uncharacterized protein (TIGR02246 family)